MSMAGRKRPRGGWGYDTPAYKRRVPRGRGRGRSITGWVPGPAALAARGSNARTGGYIGLEKKFVDHELTATALATTWAAYNPAGSVDCLTSCAQGDGESNRDGRVYHLASLHIRGDIITTTAEAEAAPSGAKEVRIVIVQDTQTNAAELTATDVMDDGGTVDLYAFRNLQYSKRFKVWKDKTLRIPVQIVNEGAVNSFASQQSRIPFNFNFTFKKPIKVTCSGTTDAVASITDNSFHLIAVSNSTSCQIQYQVRARFFG